LPQRHAGTLVRQPAEEAKTDGEAAVKASPVTSEG
jgi:hypothetical protein